MAKENLFENVKTLEEAKAVLQKVSERMDEAIENSRETVYADGEKRLYKIVKSDVWNLAHDVLEIIHFPKSLVEVIDEQINDAIDKRIEKAFKEILEPIEAFKEILEPITEGELTLECQGWDNWVETTYHEIARDSTTVEHNEKIIALQKERLELDLKRANLNMERYNEWRKSVGLDEAVTPW